MPYLSRRNKKHRRNIQRTRKGGAMSAPGKNAAQNTARAQRAQNRRNNADAADAADTARRYWGNIRGQVRDAGMEARAAAAFREAGANRQANRQPDVTVGETVGLQERLDRAQAAAYEKGDVLDVAGDDDDSDADDVEIIDSPRSPVSRSPPSSQQSSPDVYTTGFVPGPGARPWADGVSEAVDAEAAADRARRFRNAAEVSSNAARTGLGYLGSAATLFAKHGPRLAMSGFRNVYDGVSSAREAHALAQANADMRRQVHDNKLAEIERKRSLALQSSRQQAHEQELLRQHQQQSRQQAQEQQRLLQQQQNLERFYPSTHLPQQQGQVQYPHPPNNGHPSSYLSEAELAQAELAQAELTQAKLAQARIDALMTGTPSPALLRLRQEQAKQAEIARFNDLMLDNPLITVAQPVTPEATVIGKNKDYSRSQDMQDEKALQKALRESQDIATAHRTQAMQDEQALQNAMRMSKVDAETNEKQRRDRENRQLRQILEKSEMQKAMEESIRQGAIDKERIALNKAVLKSGEDAAVKAAQNISALEEIARKTGQGLDDDDDDDDEGYKTAPGSLSSSPDDEEEILLSPPNKKGGKKKRRKTRKYKKVKFIKKKRKHTHKRKLPKKSRKKRPRKFKKTLKH